MRFIVCVKYFLEIRQEALGITCIEKPSEDTNLGTVTS